MGCKLRKVFLEAMTSIYSVCLDSNTLYLKLGCDSISHSDEFVYEREGHLGKVGGGGEGGGRVVALTPEIAKEDGIIHCLIRYFHVSFASLSIAS